jgi:hypothetical protein
MTALVIVLAGTLAAIAACSVAGLVILALKADKARDQHALGERLTASMLDSWERGRQMGVMLQQQAGSHPVYGAGPVGIAQPTQPQDEPPPDPTNIVLGEN